jgi:Fe-S cluster assembly ATP-binding protein
LCVTVEDKEILKGVDLTMNQGEVHVIMGPNGSGKSTLAMTLMGHPKYQVSEGGIRFKGKDLLEMEVDQRAKEGLFLAFQHPSEITGVSVGNFIRTTLNAKLKATGQETVKISKFRKELYQRMDEHQIDHAFAGRDVNDGFSGGEKKRMEILQLDILKPTLAVLDEIDSGLDIDSLKRVSSQVGRMVEEDGLTALVITHYQRLLNYLKKPDRIHVFHEGRVVMSGGMEIVESLEEKGYEWVKQTAAQQ